MALTIKLVCWFALLLLATFVVAGDEALIAVSCGTALALTVVSALGGALTFSGLFWGAAEVVNERRRLTHDLDAIERIAGENLNYEEKAARMNEIRPSASSFTTTLYGLEWTQRLILNHAVQSLRWPALLTALGVIFATAASVWSIWMP